MERFAFYFVFFLIFFLPKNAANVNYLPRWGRDKSKKESVSIFLLPLHPAASSNSVIPSRSHFLLLNPSIWCCFFRFFCFFILLLLVFVPPYFQPSGPAHPCQTRQPDDQRSQPSASQGQLYSRLCSINILLLALPVRIIIRV